jgi:WS/DGAT/MGAT family acyltransferase
VASDAPNAELLSPADTAWLHMDRPANPMVITGVFLFDEPMGFDELHQLVERRLLRHARLRQRIVEPVLPVGRPHWEEDPSFDLRAHLHRAALPRPGNDAVLRQMIGDLMSVRLDLSRPPWHFHLLEGYGKGCALVTRMHHCLGDGASLTRLLLSVADGAAEAGSGPAAAWNGGSGNGFGWALHRAEEAVQEGLGMLLHPTQLLELGRKAVDGVLSLGRLLLLAPDPQTPLKGRLSGVKRVAWTEPLGLQEVKSVARSLGGTVNDVLLAAMSGALRRWLCGRDVLLEQSIRAVVPVNLRGSGPVPEFGNLFGMVFLPLPVEVEKRLPRFEELKRRMDAIKATPECFVAFAILEAMGATAPAIETLGVEVFSTKGTLVMTNVPGPREGLLLGGHPVRSLVFWAPQSGDIGIGVSILSYAGTVRIGVSSDAALMPDPEAVVQGFAREIAALAALARSPRRPKAPPASARNGKEGSPMAHIEKSITIDAPVDQVFQMATSIARFPEWWPSLIEVKNFEKPHAEPGGTYDWTYRMLGLTYHGTDQFTEVVRNQRYRSHSTAGEIEHAFEHLFAGEAGKTRYTLRIDYTPPGSFLGRLADSLFLHSYNEKDADQVVAKLKEICEREAAAKPKARRVKPRGAARKTAGASRH